MKGLVKWVGSTLAVLGLMAGGAGSAQAEPVVVPNDLAGTEGNSNNGFPFNLAPFGLSSQRYQQVFAASQFAAFGGPALISQIAFRPDATFGGGFSSTLSNVQIDLSTTLQPRDGLSLTFAANVGPDDTIIRSGPLPLSSAFLGPPAGPKEFDILINLTTPFVYDPSRGNLLLDVRNFGGGATTVFDAQNTSGDSISRAFTSLTGGVNSPVANASDTMGLVTRFTVAPIPEPPSLAMGGTAALAGLGYAWCRRRRAAA